MRLTDTSGEPNVRADWRGALGDGLIVRLDDPHGFEHRLGHTWARGRLREGDLLLCLEQAGDCFHNWLLLDHRTGTMSGPDGERIPALFLKSVPAPLGAYTMGRSIHRLSQDQLRELIDEGELQIALPTEYETPRAEPVTA
jgi:hypothetical protein